MHKLMIFGLLIFLLTFAMFSTLPTGVSAQDKTEIQYAAKFVCGKTDAGMAAPGEYFTTINVHNPSPNATVAFRKKFARALPNEEAGKITEFFSATLKADEAMAIDCGNIYRHSGISPGTFIDGYAVIITPAELDVVAVYTAGSPVATLHTERVPMRRVPKGCDDLDLNLSTGKTSWQIIQDPFNFTPEPRNVDAVASPPSAWGSQSGAQWVSWSAGAGPGPFPPVPREFTYQTCFCMCNGFSNAKLTLRGMSDEVGTVWLNGTQLSPTFASFSTPTLVQTTNQQLFKAGTNCVNVVVRNTTTFTGLNLLGNVTATAGACP